MAEVLAAALPDPFYYRSLEEKLGDVLVSVTLDPQFDARAKQYYVGLILKYVRAAEPRAEVEQSGPDEDEAPIGNRGVER